MKLCILIPLALAAVFGLLSCSVASRNRRAATTTVGNLPASCTLLQMTPKERQEHERRLGDLRQAAHSLSETAEGFAFKVDLRRMTLRDLRCWLDDEQRCCAFLSMDHRVVALNETAEVSVRCPKELRTEVMTTFGLR